MGGSEKLNINDVFQSLDQNEKTTLNTTKIRSQLKTLNKQKEGSIKIDAPVNMRARARQERAANYEINSKKIGKYIPQVKRAREEVQHDFTSADKLLHGGQVNINSAKQIAANSTAVTDLEIQIENELKRQGLSSEKDLVAKEVNSLGANLNMEALQKKYDDMAKLKTLLFR